MRRNLLTGFLACSLATQLLSAVEEPFKVEALFEHKFTNAAPLVTGPYEEEIVRSVGSILEKAHFRGQPLDDSTSSKFLDRYLDTLDPLHLYFLQSDLEEFERYRFELDNLIREDGDSQPARSIFRRFRTRVDQQYEFVKEQLLKGDFKFDIDERYLANRREQPRPKDLEEAHQLWRERLRYEFLQEKLGLGQPEAILEIIREKLDQRKIEDLPEALKDKLGKEKLEAILNMIKERSETESAEAVVAAVREKLEKDNHAEITKIIAKRYNRILRSINEYDNDDVLQIFLTALAHVYDPHSDYMGKAALENFSIGMKLSLFGIGALLQSEDGYCKIVSLTPNGPAERSKEMQPGDKIIAVAQGEEEPVDVVDMKLSKVVDLIRGPKATEVRLTVIPADAADPSVRKLVTLVRDEIKLEDQEASGKIFEIPSEQGEPVRLGLIDLPSFYSSFDLAGEKGQGDQKSTTLDVARLIKKLVDEKVSGIILDLRRNGGGSLEEAIKLTGLFIKEGPVVQVVDPVGRVFVEDDPDPRIFYRGPLVVLTSRFSASASEILAGALQDYGRAVIVGDNSTHGKGTVQSLIQLAPILRASVPPEVNPGALKITIRKFYRASGSSTQRDGVEPDIVLPSVNNHADVGEASLENALDHDTIKPATYEKFNWVAPLLPDLRTRSEARVAQDEDFAYLNKEIDRYRKAIEDKSVSLNEAQRIKEKKEADQRLKARRKELAARPKPPGKVYEVTLKNIDKPGLAEADAKKDATETDPAQDPVTATPQPGAEEEEEEDLPRLDITLEETKRILADFIELTAKSVSVTTAANHPLGAPNAPATDAKP